MSLMTPYAINVLPRPCCDRPRPYYNCGDWAEIGTEVRYGVCQSCGSILVCCMCGCEHEGKLTVGSVEQLARRWPEQFGEMTACQKRFRKAATTVTVSIPKLATFRLRGRQGSRDKGQEPEGLTRGRKGGEDPCQPLHRGQDATFPNGRRSGSCLLSLVSSLFCKLTALMFPARCARVPRTTDARSGRAGRAA